MHITDILKEQRTTFSFEFFPPRKEEAWRELFDTIKDLERLSPSFVSVTYGAGGTTREKTHDLVVRIKDETELDPVPHLTCVCHETAEVDEILREYAEHGISNIMALGGDPPRGKSVAECGAQDFLHAVDLVHFIRQFNELGMHPDPRGFGIGVAGFPEGHPATPNRILEMDYLKQKVDMGADYICTQLFFDNRDFFDFRERCEIAGIRVPIVAGLMPIISRRSFQRTPELALGSRYPAAFLKRIEHLETDRDIAKAGIEWTVRQCYDLLENDVRGIHFYTLNRSPLTVEIFKRLGVEG